MRDKKPSTMNYLIKNASVVNEGTIFEADVLIADGMIAEVAPCGSIHAEGVAAIEARGKYLIPGIIDEHVHFRDPGLTHKADIHTESRAAVAGGVTSFMDMPNTVPQTVTNGLLEEKFAMAAEKSLANYSFYLGASSSNLDEVLRLDTGRVCGIKLFMGSSTGNMLVDDGSALETLFREAPCLIAAHCEDEATIRRNTERYKAMAAAGEITADATIHPCVRSAEACYRSSARAVELAEKTGARLHIMHISTAEELRLFRNGIRLEDKKITAETCPHYLYFTQERYKDLGYAIKCNPAIKSADDRTALLMALGSGLIDTIGTDHAPHLREEKFAADYFGATSGFPSVQHSFDVMAEIVRQGWITLPQAVTLMCHNPATLYRIDRRGFIRKGWHADLALVDLGCSNTISGAGEFSKCGWTPYEGITVGSKVTHTFVGGNLVYENGIFHEDFRGERLQFDR